MKQVVIMSNGAQIEKGSCRVMKINSIKFAALGLGIPRWKKDADTDVRCEMHNGMLQCTVGKLYDLINCGGALEVESGTREDHFQVLVKPGLKITFQNPEVD